MIMSAFPVKLDSVHEGDVTSHLPIGLTLADQIVYMFLVTCVLVKSEVGKMVFFWIIHCSKLLLIACHWRIVFLYFV